MPKTAVFWTAVFAFATSAVQAAPDFHCVGEDDYLEGIYFYTEKKGVDGKVPRQVKILVSEYLVVDDPKERAEILRQNGGEEPDEYLKLVHREHRGLVTESLYENALAKLQAGGQRIYFYWEESPDFKTEDLRLNALFLQVENPQQKRSTFRVKGEMHGGLMVCQREEFLD